MMFTDKIESMRPGKGFTASVEDTTDLMSDHLVKEWRNIGCGSGENAKLVSLHQLSCEGNLVREAAVGGDLNVDESVRVRGDQTSTIIKAQIQKVQDRAVSLQAKAKYTDEYPTLSVTDLIGSIRQYNFQEFSEWIHVEDLMTSKKRRGEKNQTVIRPEVESLYRFLVDLCQSAVLYGYVIERSELLRHLSLSLLQHCRLLKALDFNFIKLAKYKLAAFAAFAKESDTYPKSPFSEELRLRCRTADPDFLFSGHFTRFFKRLPNSESGEKLYRMSFVDTLCRGLKKGSDRPSDELVHKSNLDTVQCFLDEREPILFRDLMVDPDGEVVIKIDMTEEVIRTTDEIIKPNSQDFSPSWHRMPSLSASYENKYSNAGSALVVKGIIQEQAILRGGSVTNRKWYGAAREGILRERIPGVIRDPLRPNDKPLSIDFDGSFDQASLYGEFSTNYENLADPLDIEALAHRQAEIRRGNQDFRSSFPVNRANEAEWFLSHMSVVGLKEALKIRGITKGEALENWLLQPLQKYLSQKLLRIPCFALTGKPLDALDLEKTFRFLSRGQKFLSGDYDNATNKMYGHYTRVCIRRICENLGLNEDWTLIAESSLCDNLVEYKYIDQKTRKLVRVRGVQKNAQPMGKILSFVVLCIVNAAVCRKSKEIDDSGNRVMIRLKDFKAQINGDDCVFTLYDFSSWEDTCKCVGLENSIGKTFFSENFIEMNSRTYLLERGHPQTVQLSDALVDLRFTLVPFVNFGLLKGLVRSSGVDDNETRFERIACLGECHTDLLTHNHHFYRELDFLFKRYNSDLLSDIQLTGIPYYVPKWLGGLGLDPGSQPWEKISLSQQRSASVVLANYHSRRPAVVSQNKTCLVHDEVNKLLDEIRSSAGLEPVHFRKLELSTGEVVDLKIENQKVYNDLVEHIWRTRDIETLKTDLEEGFLEVDAEVKSLEIEFSRQILSRTEKQILLSRRKIKRALSNNRKIWMNAYELSFEPGQTALPFYKMWHVNRELFDGYLPIIRADSVRDYRNFVRELRV